MSSNIYVEAQMLIRKPIEDVFEAFITPEITTNFWFTKSTGKLEEGKTEEQKKKFEEDMKAAMEKQCPELAKEMGM